MVPPPVRHCFATLLFLCMASFQLFIYFRENTGKEEKVKGLNVLDGFTR
jgi:hypothetical protein